MAIDPRKTERRRTHARIDGDGVKIVEVGGVRRGVWLLALALLVAGAALVIALELLVPGEPASGPAAPVAAAPGVAPAAPAPAPRPLRAVRRSAAPVAAAPTAPSAPLTAPTPTAPELPRFPDEPADQPTGIALFPPPGTDPPKVGLVVPEDFELPEGYVRHHQTTDDGVELPAILMFHPDYEWLDENGVPIPLPPDLVVPPELAPPGMPIDRLVIPEPLPEAAP